MNVELICVGSELLSGDVVKNFDIITNIDDEGYDFYIARATTREIRTILNITENTLKFHNKNIFPSSLMSSTFIINNKSIANTTLSIE